MKRIQILMVITALIAAVGALAQVPSNINSQGRLSSSGKKPLNGPVEDDASDSRKHPPGVVCGVPNGMAVFTNSGTWTRPEGINRVHVKLWGGGGGGGIAFYGYGPATTGGGWILRRYYHVDW